ncbi:MAG: AraC family ligand binding domain-containing protein [Pseudomonadota bacterium]|nr:AraC family ligand binding domain-containing protein [Pseudomonadota bacterium]
MTLQSFDAFEQQARASGFDAVLRRDWAPRQAVGEHTHPFAAHALVVEGEMWLTVDGRTRHLGPGDTFDLAPGTAHSERYGEAGATYWVARRGG